MEKGTLHEMLGGMRLQITVTFFFFCQLFLCAVVCLLFSLYVAFAKM